MSFAVIEPKKEFSEFPKVVFTRIKEGMPVRLRVLDQSAKMLHKHYIPSVKTSVVCSGYETCPVCVNNRKLIDANPGMKTNQIRGYYPRQTRYLVNVLNRTPCKKTQDGTLIFPEGGLYPATAPSGENLTSVEPQPANRIEVLERGVTLFSQLNATNDSLSDAEGNVLGIWTYDIIISAVGKGKDMVTTVTPNVMISDEIDLDALGLEKFDLDDVSLSLSPAEIEKLLNGVSLRDIFASRKVEEIVEKQINSEPQTAQSVDETIDALFNK